MTTITKVKLSGSTNGRNVLVAATATAGTLIHTATSTAAELDEIWLWAVNSSASDVKLTIEFGGVTAPNDHVEYTVPAEDGLYLIIPGLVLDGGVVMRAFAGSANVVTVNGYVNRINQA